MRSFLAIVNDELFRQDAQDIGVILHASYFIILPVSPVLRTLRFC